MTAFTYPNTFRLLHKRDFDQVFRSRARRRVKGRYLTVFALPTEQLGPRLGLVIAKKRARRAVDRNLVKRLCRERFRQQRSELASMDIVIQLAQFAPREALADDLAELFDKLTKTGGDPSARPEQTSS